MNKVPAHGGAIATSGAGTAPSASLARPAGAIVDPRKLPQPLWTGQPIDGKTVLIHAEQGFGDTIQFSRYVPLISHRGAKVILEVQPQILPLREQSSLITDDMAFADAVEAAVDGQLKTLPRGAVAAASWRDFGAVILVGKIDDAVALIGLGRLGPW